MIHMKPATKSIITALETNLNSISKDELFQDILREELDCVLITFPYKRDNDGQPTWVDLYANVFRNGQFKKVYKEIDKEDKIDVV